MYVKQFLLDLVFWGFETMNLLSPAEIFTCDISGDKSNSKYAGVYISPPSPIFKSSHRTLLQ